MNANRGVHASYHKCLTVLTNQVFRTLWSRALGGVRRHRHFDSDLGRFLTSFSQVTVASVNNHAIADLVPIERRISRFVRDPRDLVVSGYHYHRRGAEPWTLRRDPTAADWVAVNGVVPAALRPGESFAECLARLPLEDGLLAELAFRERHFASMRAWPDAPHRILVQRYEDIVDDLPGAYARIVAWFGLSRVEQVAVRRIAAFHARGGLRGRSSHARDPRPGQWRGLFTPRVEAAVLDRFGDVLDRYGYPTG